VKERRGELIRDFDLEKQERKLGGYVVDFDKASCYVCAVQLAERGEMDLAKALWKKSREGRGVSDFHGHEGQRSYLNDPPKLLARCIFEYLLKEAIRDPKRWPQIQVLTMKLFEEFPFLIKPDSETQSYFTKPRKEFLEGLTAVVKAPPPKPNSVEALLLEWSTTPEQNTRHRGFFHEMTTKRRWTHLMKGS
jgi:hypothetical protein